MKNVEPLVIELGDWPGGTLSAFECVYPDTIDGGYDLVLPIHCARHGRNYYWCLNVGHIWCDGGSPDWNVHRWLEEE